MTFEKKMRKTQTGRIYIDNERFFTLYLCTPLMNCSTAKFHLSTIDVNPTSITSSFEHNIVYK